MLYLTDDPVLIAELCKIWDSIPIESRGETDNQWLVDTAEAFYSDSMSLESAEQHWRCGLSYPPWFQPPKDRRKWPRWMQRQIPK